MSSSRTSIRATASRSGSNSASFCARSARATKPSAAAFPRASRRNCWSPPRGWAMYERSGPSAVTGPVWGGSGGLEKSPRVPSSRPHHRHPIRLERAIRGEDRESLVQRLHDEQAVERVGVVQRQVAQQVSVTDGRRKRDVTVLRHDVLHGVLELQLAHGPLDGDLPRADRAHRNEIGPPHGTNRSGPKLLQVPPNQRVGVEQQPHSDSPVNNRKTSGGSGASKSSAIQPLPFPLPGLRRWRVSLGASGTKRALGFPDLAMMISRPWAACSTSSERWVFASYRLTDSRTEATCLRRRMRLLYRT